MGSPEEREKHRMRIRSKVTKDLNTVKYRQRIKESKKKKPVDVTKLTHADLVNLIQEKEDNRS